MSANVVEGKDLMLFTGTTTKKAIALASSCKLNISHSPKEISSKDSGIWTDINPGKLKWTASSDALVTIDASTQNFELMFDSMVARSLVTITFGIASSSSVSPNWVIDASSRTYSGTAYITSLDLNAGDGDNASYTISFDGKNGLSKV